MPSNNSSPSSLEISRRLAEAIHSDHYEFDIGGAHESIIKQMTANTGTMPLYQSQGGSKGKDRFLQNTLARLRHFLAYSYNDLIAAQQKKAGYLVIATSNADEM